MCGLCGALGAADHWSSGGKGVASMTPAAERYRQASAVNAVLTHYGLRLKVWNDRYVLTGRTGKSAVVDHLGQLWPLAEAFAGEAIDPLDPTLLLKMREA
ncbi:hypothetical protein [Agrobacterium larrymoorei]|uniref:Uncharacterized protein n=1 Tax=Agrobacterium larrymoorei TaxID=160699 RepID=A0ABU0UDV8_9HYPH|nr:hypothetical protein [Agrobacterium larrymoorei]MDQ1183068.1 hypothetical protein [Agrobacterium larrymoorei]